MTTTSRLEAVHRKLGERLSDRLFQQLSGETSWANPRKGRSHSPSFMLALVVAALVHATGLALVLGGTVLLFPPWRGFWWALGGIVLLLLGWLARPRLAPEPDTVLDTREYPMLHTLLDRISQRLGTPTPAGIGVSTGFSASYMTCGWRGDRYVELGLPLLAVLKPNELLALLAHELAHGANGDPLRGRFLRSAIRTLAHWAEALRPMALGRAGAGHALGPLLSLLSLPLEFAMLGVSELLLLAARGLLLLVLRDSQRAEYLADRLACRVAGSPAMTAMLEATYLFDVVEMASRRHALTEPDASLELALRAARSEVTGAQWQDWREQSLAQKWRVDTTHPPTALRIAMLSTLDTAAPEPLLTNDEAQALLDEVGRLLLKRQRFVVNGMLEAAYGG
jgi:heat shock protein HtpX